MRPLSSSVVLCSRSLSARGHRQILTSCPRDPACIACQPSSLCAGKLNRHHCRTVPRYRGIYHQMEISRLDLPRISASIFHRQAETNIYIPLQSGIMYRMSRVRTKSALMGRTLCRIIETIVFRIFRWSSKSNGSNFVVNSQM